MTRRAFTLIEILLVTALIASLSLAIFTCLSNGLRLWERSRRAVQIEDISLFFDRFSSDVRNAFVFSTIPFKGEETSFAFPTVVGTRADVHSARVEEEQIDQIGATRYSFDPEKGSIRREQANYSQATKELWDEARVLVAGAQSLGFKYYYPGQSDYQRHTKEGETLPSGVEVEVRFIDGGEERTLARFVPIPAGM